MSLCSLVVRLSGVRVAIVDVEKSQDSGGASATLGDRSFSLAIAKVDVDNAHGSQRLPCFFRGDVQLYRLEFLLQRSIQQKGQRSNEDMGVDSIRFPAFPKKMRQTWATLAASKYKTRSSKHSQKTPQNGHRILTTSRLFRFILMTVNVHSRYGSSSETCSMTVARKLDGTPLRRMKLSLRWVVVISSVSP